MGKNTCKYLQAELIGFETDVSTGLQEEMNMNYENIKKDS
jgi:hypothetical protein